MLSRARTVTGRFEKRSGCEHEPVDRRRPEADDRIREPEQALVRPPALLPVLALAEPAHLAAHDHLDGRRAGGVGQRGALEAVLPTADDQHAPAGELPELLMLDCERHAAGPLELGQLRQPAREGRHADRGHDPTGVELVAGRRAHPERAACPLDVADVGRVDVRHELLAEPVGVAQERLQRHRLDPLAADLVRPALQRAPVARGGQPRLAPVGAQQHLRRHHRPPRPHRRAEHAHRAKPRGEMGRERQAVGPGADDRDIQEIHPRSKARLRPHATVLSRNCAR